jgi:hypothetical protein
LNLTSVELQQQQQQQQHGISFEEHIASFYLEREMEIKEETNLYRQYARARQYLDSGHLIPYFGTYI